MKPNPTADEGNLSKTLTEVGKRLTALRIEKGYENRLDFINDYGLSPIQYWRMEKGTANLTFKSLNKILAIHGLTIEDFFKQV